MLKVDLTWFGFVRHWATNGLVAIAIEGRTRRRRRIA